MAPPAVSAMDWSTMLTHSVGSALYHQSHAHFYHNHHPVTIDGYAFNCNGLVIGFYQHDLYCQGASGGDTFDCGTYDYNGFTLEGTSSVVQPPAFIATHLLKQDGLLLSFVLQDMTCNIVSLDWHNYSLVEFYGLTCPPQDVIPGISVQHQHFSFGSSGDVALRNVIDITTTTNSGAHPQIKRDSYGVYQWMEDGSIKIYFGPQQSLHASVVKGTLLKGTSELYLEGNDNPCLHDGTSTLATVETFPQLISGRQNEILVRIQQLVSLEHLKTLWTRLKKSKAWLSALGFGGVPALGVGVTAFVTGVLFENNWPRIAVHPSFLPMFYQNSTWRW